MAGVKLKRLTIHTFPNVAPGTELVFNDTWNVLLGRNGTGKTTLLKLIAMVVRDDFSDLKETEFSIEYALSFSDAELVISLENSPGGRFAPRTLWTSLKEMAWSTVPAEKWSYRVALNKEQYRCSLSSNPSGTTYDMSFDKHDEEDQTVLHPFDGHSLVNALFRILRFMGALNYHDLNFFAVLEAALPLRRVGRFDESLTGFQILCGAAPAHSGSSLSPALVIAHTEGTRVSLSETAESLWPSSLIPYLNGLPAKALNAESLRLRRNQARFLQRTVELFDFVDGEMILHLVRKDNVGLGDDILSYGKFSFLFTLPGGSQINQDALSYGQKRLLAFLYYVACNDEIIIADELVNGMHYDWIEACLNEIGDRQSFLTSQNPLLLDFLSFASPEEVQKSFIQCTRTPPAEGNGRAQFAWHNLSAEDAATFFRAYEAGVQHVSEILKTKGMW